MPRGPPSEDAAAVDSFRPLSAEKSAHHMLLRGRSTLAPPKTVKPSGQLRPPTNPLALLGSPKPENGPPHGPCPSFHPWSVGKLHCPKALAVLFFSVSVCGVLACIEGVLSRSRLDRSFSTRAPLHPPGALGHASELGQAQHAAQALSLLRHAHHCGSILGICRLCSVPDSWSAQDNGRGSGRAL
ncbi:hypothetical protein B0H63DRAFT_192373 [Podospora didyma]|uniref:Uncharacterized protein n=1 Tax=Podospora didyma TaxID=330526 RepID=A0AAE0NR22_9PEZI|nr:hypothetical protein B0H63DRAFT_192373 [Podospora didyma]